MNSSKRKAVLALARDKKSDHAVAMIALRAWAEKNYNTLYTMSYRLLMDSKSYPNAEDVRRLARQLNSSMKQMRDLVDKINDAIAAETHNG